jgi:hypothetical protein
MKAEQFKEVIRRLIAEEVKKEVASQLPKLLFEMVGAKSKPLIQESKHSVKQRIPNDGSDPDSQFIKQTTPKQMKHYVKDPKLNAILNETTPGLPQSPYGSGVPIEAFGNFDKVGVSQEFMGEMREIMNESVDSNTEHTEPINEIPSGTVNLNRLFNQNFKAILDESMKKGTRR